MGLVCRVVDLRHDDRVCGGHFPGEIRHPERDDRVGVGTAFSPDR